MEQTLCYSFKNRVLLFEALTHKSAIFSKNNKYQIDGLPWNERFEFLGDSVLGLIISSKLMEKGDHLREGDLSRIRSNLVNTERLADLGRKLGLGEYVFLGKVEAKSRNRDALLADTFEALIGAIYLDGGIVAAKNTIELIYEELLDQDVSSLDSLDYKTILQELTQETHKKTPKYEVVQESGPDHKKLFEVVCVLGDDVLGYGKGASKKRASQTAAQNAFNQLLNHNEVTK